MMIFKSIPILLWTIVAVLAADSSPDNDVLQSSPTSYQFSYSTGNEGTAAQLFREEQRSPDGSVVGKYGYVDPNGHLRVVNYRAGIGGFVATGDIGPDRETMRVAAQLQQSDEATRQQNEVWQKMRSSLNWGNWGVPSWAQPSTPVTTDWNAMTANWNAINARPQQTPPPPPPPSAASERQWDDRPSVTNSLADNNWSNPNNWNTWNWNSPSTSRWQTTVNHDRSAPAASQNSGSGRPSLAGLSNQWPEPPKASDNALTGGAYTYFNVDHSGSDNSPPFKYGYSY